MRDSLAYWYACLGNEIVIASELYILTRSKEMHLDSLGILVKAVIHLRIWLVQGCLWTALPNLDWRHITDREDLVSFMLSRNLSIRVVSWKCDWQQVFDISKDLDCYPLFRSKVSDLCVETKLWESISEADVQDWGMCSTFDVTVCSLITAETQECQQKEVSARN